MNNEPMVIAQGRKWLMPRSARFGLAVAALAAIITGGIAWRLTHNEHQRGLDDLQRRAELLSLIHI